MECVRVDTHGKQTCWSRCWRLAGTVTAEGKKNVRFNALRTVQIHADYRKAHKLDSKARTGALRHVSTGCMKHYPAIIWTIHLENHKTRNSCWVPCQDLKLKLYNCLLSLSLIMGWIISKATPIWRKPDRSEADFIAKSQLQHASAHCAFSGGLN